MHGLQACLFKCITFAAFRIYALCDDDATKRGRLGAVHYIVMEITFVDHGKIVELCF